MVARRRRATVRSACLLGRRHVELDAIGIVAEGRAAISLCRGGAPKTYDHTDPNEDAVCFAEGEGGHLVAVADGHDGFSASERALQYLLEVPAEIWTAAEAPFGCEQAWRQAAYAAVAGANHAILEEAAERHLPPARTTLSLALVRPEQGLLIHASMGDSHIFRAAGDEIRDLGWSTQPGQRSHYLGYAPMGRDPESDKCLIGSHPLDEISALLLVTDGLSERGIGVPDPRSAVREALAEVSELPPELRPLHACKRLTETSLAAHRSNRAGDNVACALLWLAD